ncbi:MAG: hypothetical protein FWG32_08655 [Oscillospiraceae bacterium]|nr:hypothetical protein [Oscillospiraceae bacterium]
MKKTAVKILAVAVALTMLFALGLPALASTGDITEQKTYPNGNSFHCGQNGGNGRVEVEVDGVIYGGGPVTFVKVGMDVDEKGKDVSVWELDHDEFYCTVCGRNDWVAYSNKTDELKGGNPQVYHPGGTPPEIEPDPEPGRLFLEKIVEGLDADFDDYPICFEFTVSDEDGNQTQISCEVNENNITMLVNGVWARYLELPEGDYLIVEDCDEAADAVSGYRFISVTVDGDDASEGVWVTIEDDADKTVTFTNAYEADEDEEIPEDPDPVTVDFYKRTLVNGAVGTPAAGAFEFVLYKDGEEDPTDNSFNDAAGLVSFTFTKDDIGKYVIKENVPAIWTLANYRQGLSFEVILEDEVLAVVFDDEITELELSFELDYRVFVNSRTTGGGGDDGGGDDDGDIPQRNDTTEVVNIPTPEVPLAPAPAEAPPETIIEEEVPLGDLPQTGDNSMLPLLFSLIGVSLAGMFTAFKMRGTKKSKIG